MTIHLSFGQRCFALLGIPVVVISLWLMWDRWQTAENLANLDSLAQTAPIVSGLIHEMQKERGYSAGFIGSKGSNFAPNLTKQRQHTAAALTTYQQVFSTEDTSTYGDDFAVILETADQAIAQLEQKRAAVSALSLTVGEMAGYYTGTINKLLELTNFVTVFATNDELIKVAEAYKAVLLAKERAGLERAMGANGFGKGKFAPKILRKFVDLIGQQKAFSHTFATIATPEQRAFAAATLSGPVVEEVERLRGIAIASPFTNDLKGVAGGEWFDAITKKIELMKQLEDRMASELIAVAVDQKEAVIAEFWSFVIALVLALTAIGALGWYMARDVVLAIRNVVDAIGQLAAGQETIIKGDSRQDEIGDLCRSMTTVYQKGLEATRLRSALDGCSTMLIVANKRSEIVYATPSIMHFFEKHRQDLKQDLSSFNDGNILGTQLANVSPIFGELENSVKARRDCQTLDTTIGSRRIHLVGNPVVNQTGTILGTVFEFSDLTVELTFQEEIDRVIQAVRQGDFDQAIDLQAVEGSYSKLGEGVNQLTGVIKHAVDELGASLKAMSGGDMTRRIGAGFSGRLGELRDDANLMADQLTDIVGQIQNATIEVDNAASEISSGTEDLSNRTEQAASNLEETAASAEEMAATVKQNAENAKNANQLAASADKSAKTGGQVVEQAVGAMRKR